MHHAAAAQEWLDARAGELAALLVRLVAVNTDNPPGRGLANVPACRPRPCGTRSRDGGDRHRRRTETIHTVAEGAGAEVTIDVLQQQPSGATEPSDSQAAWLAECVAAIEGGPPRLELCPGVLETRWYSQLGIPAFGDPAAYGVKE